MPQIAKDQIRQALEASADEIVEMAKRLAPVLKEPDGRRKAGALRDSIDWTWGKAPKGAITLGKVAEASLAGDLTITIYAGNSEAFYARWVEFGTQNSKAQPYFYPAYRASKKRARSRVRRSITKAAKQVANQ
ncbi:HK97-gp10 family putative phage morphogenesis protein [Brucellaceae bacterium C25G]